MAEANSTHDGTDSERFGRNVRKPHSRLHTDEDAAIRAEHEAGKSANQIAKDRGLDAPRVCKAIRRAGGVVRNRSEAGVIRWKKAREKAARDFQVMTTPLDPSVGKQCGGCLLYKTFDQFHNDARTRDGLDSQCKECSKQSYQRFISGPNVERKRAEWRADRRFRALGVTVQQYNEMFKAQNGLCAICGKPETEMYRGRLRELAVDHDHRTGVIRELLCGYCNKGLGCFNDNPILLRQAADYLIEHLD